MDEAVFIARASEGSLSVEWVMDQPPFMRKKFVDSFREELEERKRKMQSKK